MTRLAYLSAVAARIPVGFYIGAALCLVFAILNPVINDVDAKFAAAEARAVAWNQWAIVHCRIVSASAGGFNSREVIAYRCDDNRDYLQRGWRAPDTWEVR
jgi:hypothetical protein